MSDTPVRTEPSVQEMFEHEIYTMLMEAKDYREKLAAAKTSTKKKYYEKKLQHLTPIVDRAIEIYDVYKQRKAEEAKMKEAEVDTTVAVEYNEATPSTGE